MSFSSPTVVGGPCPGKNLVPSSRVSSLARIAASCSAYSRLPVRVPPIDPANTVSPTSTPSRRAKAVWPGAWPGRLQRFEGKGPHR